MNADIAKQLHLEGFTQAEIAKKLQQTVIGKPSVKTKGGRQRNAATRKRTPEFEAEVRRRVEAGEPVPRAALAEQFGVGEKAVQLAHEHEIGRQAHGAGPFGSSRSGAGASAPCTPAPDQEEARLVVAAAGALHDLGWEPENIGKALGLYRQQPMAVADKAAVARRFQAERGWSLQRVADAMGVSRPAVSQWLKNDASEDRPTTVIGRDGVERTLSPRRPPVSSTAREANGGS